MMDVTGGLILMVMWINTLQAMTLWPFIVAASWLEDCMRDRTRESDSNIVIFRR
jgi:hypothetical protein